MSVTYNKKAFVTYFTVYLKAKKEAYLKNHIPKKYFLFRCDPPTSIKKLHKLTRLDESTTLYKCMKPKQTNTWEEKVSQITEIIEQEDENLFGILGDEEKLTNILSGVGLDDDIAENILNMVDIGKFERDIFDRIDWLPKKYHFWCH